MADQTSSERASDVAIFAVTCDGMFAADIMVKAATEVKDMMMWMSLGTKLKFDESVSELEFCLNVIIGTVLGDARLNDDIVSSAIYHILEETRGMEHLITSVVVQRYNTLDIPHKHIQDAKCIVIPVNLGNFHWTLITVGVTASGTNVYLYDPLYSELNLARIESIWLSKIRPMVDTWFRRDFKATRMLTNIVHESKPKQNDDQLWSVRFSHGSCLFDKQFQFPYGSDQSRLSQCRSIADSAQNHE